MSLNDLPGDRPKLGLSARTYLTIIHAALNERPKEMCGLLYRNPTDRSLFRELSFAVLPNVSEDPTRSFVVDPEAQRSLKERFQIMGLVHSHPVGEARPSDYDKGSWAENGWWYLVVGLATGVPVIGAWRIDGGDFVKAKLRVI